MENTYNVTAESVIIWKEKYSRPPLKGRKSEIASISEIEGVLERNHKKFIAIILEGTASPQHQRTIDSRRTEVKNINHRLATMMEGNWSRLLKTFKRFVAPPNGCSTIIIYSHFLIFDKHFRCIFYSRGYLKVLRDYFIILVREKKKEVK